MKRFPEKRVVITGAGSGFGRALALVFAEKGWRVGVSDINEERADETVRLVNAAGGSGEKRACDVTGGSLHGKMGRGGHRGQECRGGWRRIHGGNFTGSLEMDARCGHDERYLRLPLLYSRHGKTGRRTYRQYGLRRRTTLFCRDELLQCAQGRRYLPVRGPAHGTGSEEYRCDRGGAARERQATMASSFFEKSKATAEDVARHAYRCVEKNKFYALCQMDGKVFWLMKRLFPETYLRVAAYVYKKGLMDKYLNAGGAAKK